MQFQQASLQQLIIHYTGNKNHNDPLLLSQNALEVDDETSQLLADSFLARFTNNHEYYSFNHSTSLQYNEVYQYCLQVFKDEGAFTEASAAIATHLYNQSVHPKVKGGELYVVYFNAIPVESRMCKAIGLFKSETKTFFLDTKQKKQGIELVVKEGIEITKLDKGCLIINQKEEEGFDVLLFDNQNRGEEAQYWKEKFLGVVPQRNEFHQTNHLLTLAKQFITGPLETEMKLSKNDQVEMLHKSIDYFKSKESFDIEEFQQTVFAEDDKIEAFRQFGSRYTEANDFDLAASFDISTAAVKKQSRNYKTVVKLDKNFHIYIHGRTDLIEKGVDNNGRKFYKIFYQEEA